MTMHETGRGPGEEAPGRPFGKTTVVVGLCVLALAVAALLVPWSTDRPGKGILLVVDPLGAARGERVFGPLAAWLTERGERPLRLEVATTLGELADRSWQDVELVLCHDRVALGLPRERFATLAAGRRHPPHNLRPRSVLVHRLTAAPLAEPWLAAPDRTVLGDTLSLAGSGVFCERAGQPSGRGPGVGTRPCASGPDPFDHGPALHALRLGCFDYAVVRELAADRFFADGLLRPGQWGVQELSPPLPDVVVLVSRDLPARRRVRLGEILVGLGRHPDGALPAEEAVRARLAEVGLDGFNLLVEPDFDMIERRYYPCWPDSGF